MRMCVHATIAAITALAGSGSIAGGDAVAVTASGEHRVSWAGDEQPDVTSNSPRRPSGAGAIPPR